MKKGEAMSELRREQIIPFPWARVPIEDSLRAKTPKPLMHALTEVDVTLARRALLAHERKTGEKLSFTAYISGCVARAVQEYPMTQAYRLGRRRLIVFDDVDICLPVEHGAGRDRQASPYVIRAANRMPLRTIHETIRAAQRADLGGVWEMRLRRLAPHIPWLLRRSYWWAFNRYPRLKRRIGGTVMVTAVGMFGTNAAWGVSPVSDYTLQVILGSVVERLELIDGHVEARQRLCMTLSADHIIIDGAPFARFIQRLGQLIASGYGLETAGVSLDISGVAAAPVMTPIVPR